MAEIKTVNLDVEIICDGCKVPLEVISSQRNTTPNAGAVDGKFEVYVQACVTCTEEEISVDTVNVNVNGEQFAINL